MDIEFFIRKGVTYAYASFLLLIPLFAVIIVAQIFTFQTTNYPFSALIFFSIVTAAYFFPRVKVKAEKTIEQLIFRDKYDYKKTLRDLSKAMVSILDLNELCRKIITTSTEALLVEKASIYIFDEEKSVYMLRDCQGSQCNKLDGTYRKDELFFKWAEMHKDIFIREELERFIDVPEAIAVAEKMSQMEAELCIPLFTKKKLIGIINLGMKENKEMYTHEDLEMLTTLANNATIAIENSQLYESLMKTKQVMLRAERLAALGTLSAGLAHEIRNPLVAIKTFTQLLPERYDDEEFRNYFLNVTAGEIDRISSLVTELLEFARPSEPFFQQEDINSTLEKMIKLINNEAKKKDLQIVTNLELQLPTVTMDKEQMKQVFLNILLNAIQATPEKGKISIRTSKNTQNANHEFIQVEISDTGKGVSPEEVDKIFTPFYTTRSQGSGLGLAISHQIVEEHEGTITVESILNKGAVFTVNLPVNPLLFKGNKGSERPH
jgi:signal transduction histidine kinase